MNTHDDDCEVAAGLLPDFWHDNLSGPERAADGAWLRAHLAFCAGCAELNAGWRRLGALPDARPGPEARQRFDAMLEAYQQGATATAAARPVAGGWKARFGWNPMPALAAGVCLLVGLGGGWALRGGTDTRAAATPEAQQIAELRDQVRTTQQLAVLSLLQQQSASDRLRGVSWSNRLQSPDPQVVEALTHSLNYDASPDVRLAALDALQRAATTDGAADATTAAIRRQLVAAFAHQQSPLVQIALVDSFVDMRDTAARTLLQQVRNDTGYNAEVRQRAAWGLAQPTWN